MRPLPLLYRLHPPRPSHRAPPRQSPPPQPSLTCASSLNCASILAFATSLYALTASLYHAQMHDMPPNSKAVLDAAAETIAEIVAPRHWPRSLPTGAVKIELDDEGPLGSTGSGVSLELLEGKVPQPLHLLPPRPHLVYPILIARPRPIRTVTFVYLPRSSMHSAGVDAFVAMEGGGQRRFAGAPLEENHVGRRGLRWH